VTSAVCIGPNFQTEQNMSEMEYICLGKNWEIYLDLWVEEVWSGLDSGSRESSYSAPERYSSAIHRVSCWMPGYGNSAGLPFILVIGHIYVHTVFTNICV
jgi:hypothetical protein